MELDRTGADDVDCDGINDDDDDDDEDSEEVQLEAVEWEESRLNLM